MHPQACPLKWCARSGRRTQVIWYSVLLTQSCINRLHASFIHNLKVADPTDGDLEKSFLVLNCLILRSNYTDIFALQMQQDGWGHQHKTATSSCETAETPISSLSSSSTIKMGNLTGDSWAKMDYTSTTRVKPWWSVLSWRRWPPFGLCRFEIKQ